MTAVNAIVRPDAAYLFSDGTALDRTGAMSALVSKQTIVGAFPAAWAVRGSTGWVGTVGEAFFGRFDSFDAMTQQAVSAVRQAVSAETRPWAAEPFFLTVVGWSEARDRPVLYNLTRNPANPIKGWTAGPSPACITPFSPALGALLHAEGIDPEDASADPVATGVRIMTLQREMEWGTFPDLPRLRSVGGFCQATIITREGVSTRVVERWPDRVGQVVGS